MEIFLFILAGFGLGYFVGLISGEIRDSTPRITLAMSISLDATQPVTVKVFGRDSEGNQVDLSDAQLTLTAESTNEKVFGELNDELDTFNPGEAGATGIIKGEIEVDGVKYETSVEIELVAGGLSTLDLAFNPVS